MNPFFQPTLWSGIALVALASAAHAQAGTAVPEKPALQQQFDAAQRLQQSGQNAEAARAYRAFVANAQEELAAGYMTSGDFSRAEQLAQAVLSDPPEDARLRANAHQILGRALLKKFDAQGAKAEFEQAAGLDASFANRYDLAIACLDLDDDACATHIFEELEQSVGDTPALHMQFGIAYGNSDFVPKAVAEFRKTIAEDPRFPGAHYCLAAALLSLGDDQKNIPEAEAELHKELEITPRDPLSYAALGRLAASAHRSAEAETDLRKAIALNPRNPDPYLYLGQLYADMGRLADAEKALRRSIELTKDPARNRYQVQKAHFLLGRVLMQEHQPEEAHREMELARTFAQKDLSRDRGQLAGMLTDSAATGTSQNAAGPAAAASPTPAVAANLRAYEQRLTPAIAESYNNLGVIAATGGQYGMALTDFDLAAEWNPALAGLDLNRGRAAFMASRFSDAVAPLTRYVRTHPGDSGVRGALAMSQFMTHDYAGCLQTLQGMEGKLSSIPQMDYVFADSLVQTGQTAEGIRRLEALEAAHPEIPDVHRALGEALALQHETQKAAAEFHTALVLNGGDAQAHFDLGKLSLESGDAAAAIPQLQAAVRLAPKEAAFHRELAQAYRAVSRNQDAQQETETAEKLTREGGTKPPAGPSAAKQP